TPDIDVRDIVTSLSFGVAGEESRPGYGAIGRSVTMTRSLSGYLLPFVGRRDVDSAALARLSASKQSLAKADPNDAQKAIALVRAPSANIGPGSHSVETGTIKEYLERSCRLNEVNLGVALSGRNLASVVTLLTYRREDLDRLD
ncbi:cell division protein FtsZ, partial [Halorubrum ezzemoulense]|nr:cell division protein FtsZ [Halorubrum ezzemoulense]